jgi:hypothetical protein
MCEHVLSPHAATPAVKSVAAASSLNLRAIQILWGQTKIENTVRYLGVDIEDALILAEGTGICAGSGPL